MEVKTKTCPICNKQFSTKTGAKYCNVQCYRKTVKLNMVFKGSKQFNYNDSELIDIPSEDYTIDPEFEDYFDFLN